MPVKHLFQSAVSDGADNTLVQPSDWNEGHVTPYASGTFTVPTGNGSLQVDTLELTSTLTFTLEGTATLRIL
jgi:hypothetical protein